MKIIFNLNERQYIRFQTIFLAASLFSFLLAGFHSRTWQEFFAGAIPKEETMSETKMASGENDMKEQAPDSGGNAVDVFQPEERETNITVYTYGEESYTVRGMMDVIYPEDGEGEYFLEISGPVEKEETVSGKIENMLENVHPDEFGDASVSLTIYDGEKVYGFFGKAKVTEEMEDSVQRIEIMGHKEGFYDGEAIYSQSTFTPWRDTVRET